MARADRDRREEFPAKVSFAVGVGVHDPGGQEGGYVDSRIPDEPRRVDGVVLGGFERFPARIATAESELAVLFESDPADVGLALVEDGLEVASNWIGVPFEIVRVESPVGIGFGIGSGSSVGHQVGGETGVGPAETVGIEEDDGDGDDDQAGESPRSGLNRMLR